ncbi:MAG: hypothetical protein AAGI53_14710 [Planctomycetota bacterium]
MKTPPFPNKFLSLAFVVLALALCLQASALPDLADEPLRLDRAGIALRVPIGAKSETRTLANRQVTTITLPESHGTIVVQARINTQNTETTAEQDAARLLAEAIELPDPTSFDPNRSRPRTAKGEFLGPGPVVATKGTKTRALYAKLAPRRQSDPIIRGIAVLDAADGRRVVFDLLTSGRHADSARPTFEAILATVIPRSDDLVAKANEAERRSAATLLAGLTKEELAVMLADAAPRFERLFRPGGSAATDVERGYRRTIASTGHRGDVTGTPRERWSAAEREPGYIVAVDARLLGESGERIDSKARYFLSESRRDETWSVTMSVRSEGPVAVWTETGARQGRDLTISISQGRSGRRTIRPDFKVEGFLSRVESLLLPRLLAAAAEPGTYTFNAYDSQREGVVERIESLSRTDRGWSLDTRFEDGRTQATQLSPSGTSMRTEMDSGLVWEATDFDRLYRLWSSKGLPLN